MLSFARDVNKLDQKLKSIRFGRNGGRNTLFLIKITKFLCGLSSLWQEIINFHPSKNQLTAMRVTVNIPEELLKEVMKITGAKTKSQAVKLALEETIARAKRRKLITITGTINLDLDLDVSRGRN
jgi:Arc/MetJ family transcription regulator